MNMSITDKLAAVRANIALAAARSGRDERDILLVGATKMNDTARVREAIAAGLSACGENRVQEMLAKKAEGAYDGAKLHFIGHLQSNKVKNVVGQVELIESVHSYELLREINKHAKKLGIVQDVLIEVNIANEASKSGISPQELPDILALCGGFEALRVRGLMSIPPICASGEENRPYFRAMQQLFVDNGEKKYDNVYMDFLSMGMSGDYAVAVECGANIVRVGSAIFGERHYT